MTSAPDLTPAVDAYPTANETAEHYGYLRTVGRSSGRTWETEIWFVTDPATPQQLYILSEQRERANWMRNLQATGTGAFRIGDRVWQITDHGVASDPELDTRIRAMIPAKYPGQLSDEYMANFQATGLPYVLHLGAVETDAGATERWRARHVDGQMTQVLAEAAAGTESVAAS